MRECVLFLEITYQRGASKGPKEVELTVSHNANRTCH